jgi:hypothetical protein
MALVAPRPAAASPGAPSAGPNIDWTLSAARIAANCAAAIARTKAGVDAIVRISPSRRTFATVVRPLEDVTSDLNDDLVAETTLVQVSPNRAVRDASQACQNDVNDLYAAITARPDLYAAVSSAASGATAQTVADRKLSELWVTQLRRAGAALSPADRARFVALNQQLNTLQAQFAENLANDKTTVVITKGQTAGLPADFLATLTPAADGGGLVVPVNESTAPRFMESAADPLARKAYYLAYNNRGVPRNEEVLRAAIAARDEAAHLIGYPTWADYVLADRMAATPARVRSFLDDLDAKLLPRAADDLAALAALKARTTHERAASIDPWDVAYYDNLLRKTKYAVDADRVREYFPVDPCRRVRSRHLREDARRHVRAAGSGERLEPGRHPVVHLRHLLRALHRRLLPGSLPAGRQVQPRRELPAAAEPAPCERGAAPAARRDHRKLAGAGTGEARAALARRGRDVLPRIRPRYGDDARDRTVRDTERRLPLGLHRSAVPDAGELGVGPGDPAAHQCQRRDRRAPSGRDHQEDDRGTLRRRRVLHHATDPLRGRRPRLSHGRRDGRPLGDVGARRECRLAPGQLSGNPSRGVLRAHHGRLRRGILRVSLVEGLRAGHVHRVPAGRARRPRDRIALPRRTSSNRRANSNPIRRSRTFWGAR